jgi:hypothetical protein
MLGNLAKKLTSLASVLRDQKKFDAALPSLLRAVGVEINKQTLIEGNRFDTVEFVDKRGSSGVCTYGLGGYLLLRDKQLVRIEIGILGGERSTLVRLLDRIGRHIYQAYKYPSAKENYFLRSANGFRVVRRLHIPIEGQRASMFEFLYIERIRRSNPTHGGRQTKRGRS